MLERIKADYKGISFLDFIDSVVIPEIKFGYLTAQDAIDFCQRIGVQVDDDIKRRVDELKDGGKYLDRFNYWEVFECCKELGRIDQYFDNLMNNLLKETQRNVDEKRKIIELQKRLSIHKPNAL